MPESTRDQVRTNHPPVEAAEAAIDAHTRAMGVDDEGDRARIGLWHLLGSLLEYADKNGIDFDAMLHDVRTELASPQFQRGAKAPGAG